MSVIRATRCDASPANEPSVGEMSWWNGAPRVVAIAAGTETVRLTCTPAVVGVTGFGENVQVIPAGALGQVSETGAAEFP